MDFTTGRNPSAVPLFRTAAGPPAIMLNRSHYFFITFRRTNQRNAPANARVRALAPSGTVDGVVELTANVKLSSVKVSLGFVERMVRPPISAEFLEMPTKFPLVPFTDESRPARFELLISFAKTTRD